MWQSGNWVADVLEVYRVFSNFKEFEYLKLYVRQSESLTDVPQPWGCLGGLTNLQMLTLKLEVCTNLLDISELYCGVGKLTKSNRLAISFEDCSRIASTHRAQRICFKFWWLHQPPTTAATEISDTDRLFQRLDWGWVSHQQHDVQGLEVLRAKRDAL